MHDERITLKRGGAHTFDKSGSLCKFERISGGFITISAEDCIDIFMVVAESGDVEPEGFYDIIRKIRRNLQL